MSQGGYFESERHYQALEIAPARPAGPDLGAPLCEADLASYIGDEQLLSELLQGAQQRGPKGGPYPSYFPGEPYPFLSYGGERKGLGAFDPRAVAVKEEPRGGDAGRAGGRVPYNAMHFPAAHCAQVALPQPVARAGQALRMLKVRPFKLPVATLQSGFLPHSRIYFKPSIAQGPSTLKYDPHRSHSEPPCSSQLTHTVEAGSPCSQPTGGGCRVAEAERYESGLSPFKFTSATN